jgi:3-oxoacyl-[acyl-carrier-protein] synthase-3
VNALLYLHAVGHFHPENVIDNAFLEDLDIGTTDEWIVERVGIKTRRTVLPLDYIRDTKNADPRAAAGAALYDNAETGKRAAEHVMARAGISAADVGMVIAGGCAPDLSIPAEACRVAAALGIEAPAFDVGSACSSFGVITRLLASMKELPPYVLVVNAENTTRVVDYSDRSTAVLWGDGTSAALFSTEVPSRMRVVETMMGSSPAGAGLVTIPRSGHFTQDGSAVQRFAIKTTLSMLGALRRAARADVRFIGHQANALVLEAVGRRGELPPDAHWSNVAEFGNTGAAGAPSVLSQRWDELAGGEDVILAVVGSGLTWAGLRIEVD